MFEIFMAECTFILCLIERIICLNFMLNCTIVTGMIDKKGFCASIMMMLTILSELKWDWNSCP